MIPDEAIEAAAESLVGSTLGDRRGINWEEFFEAARLALNAAYPILLSHERQQTADAHRDAVVNRKTIDRLERELEYARADAWEEGVSDGQWNAEHAYQIESGARTAIVNPWRSQA